MARAFAKISFTPNVQKIQSAMGSRHNYQAFEQGDIEPALLTAFEKQFIQARDSFYQATVGENGWPYVQHRGGPTGFLKVLDDTTIAYADFTGNRQYVSVGNLSGDDRISLILMNYPERQRLKIWGRARIVDEAIEPELIAQLESTDFRAPIERGVVITVEAFDWNCPKYITPRFTADEIDTLKTDATQETSKQTTTAYAYTGNGSIPLVITAVNQLADHIRGYTFQHADKLALPSFEAGAHISVPVQLADGTQTTRAYSLTSTQQNSYQIAVKQEAEGQGASMAIHQHWQVGQRIHIEAPDNYFALHDSQQPTVLIAGGIGITPIKAMAETLAHQQRPFTLHYTGKSLADMAFVDTLMESCPTQCHVYFSQDHLHTLDIQMVLQQSSDDTVFYVCGPSRLIKAIKKTALSLGINRGRLHVESFI